MFLFLSLFGFFAFFRVFVLTHRLNPKSEILRISVVLSFKRIFSGLRSLWAIPLKTIKKRTNNEERKEKGKKKRKKKREKNKRARAPPGMTDIQLKVQIVREIRGYQ